MDRGTWGVVTGIYNDAKLVVVDGRRAFTDPTMTAEGLEALGEATFNTALNFAAAAGAVSKAARVSKLGKIQ